MLGELVIHCFGATMQGSRQDTRTHDEVRMSEQKNAKRPLIVGKPALIMVDFQRGGSYVPGRENGIPTMGGWEERRRTACALVTAARANGVPVVFIQEVHRPDLVDFGRELDGTEDVHCLEGLHSTEIDAEAVDYRPGDY